MGLLVSTIPPKPGRDCSMMNLSKNHLSILLAARL